MDVGVGRMEDCECSGIGGDTEDGEFYHDEIRILS
jgi:hypothetical protein